MLLIPYCVWFSFLPRSNAVTFLLARDVPILGRVERFCVILFPGAQYESFWSDVARDVRGIAFGSAGILLDVSPVILPCAATIS